MSVMGLAQKCKHGAPSTQILAQQTLWLKCQYLKTLKTHSEIYFRLRMKFESTPNRP